MPSDKEHYEGSYAPNITDHAVFKHCRLWYHTRRGRMEFFKDGTSFVTLKDKHRAAHSTSDGPHHIVKAFLVSELGDYVATCGYTNDWLVWKTSDGALVARLKGREEFYPPRTRATFIIFGAFARLRLMRQGEVQPFETLEHILDD